MCDCKEKYVYIIGNGFDCHHKLPTMYCDFKNHLKELNPELVTEIDKVLIEKGFNSDEIKTWSKLEEYLEEFPNLDYDQIFMDAFDGAETDMDRASYWHDPEFNANRFSEDKNNILLGVKKHFKGWIDSIFIEKDCRDNSLKLSKKSKYLSFNYTKTLEIVYDIPQQNILYIHSINGDYIIGHNGQKEIPYSDPYNCYMDEETGEECSDEDFRSIRVKEELNRAYESIYYTYYKDSENIILKNSDWLNCFKNAKKIIFMGFSFGIEDMVYIDYIAQRLSFETKIIVYYYSPSDYEKAKNICEEKFSFCKTEYIKW